MKENFEEWALSFSGCEGGHDSADIWLAGIEWGFNKKHGESDQEYENRQSDYYLRELPAEIAAGKFVPRNSYDWQGSLKYTYGRSVAKLISAIKGLDSHDYVKNTKSFAPNELFKVNLYPIAFRESASEHTWQKFNLHTLTGFETKELYKFWCFHRRFEFFREQITKSTKAPKLIICTGVTHLNEFYTAFAGNKFSPDLRTHRLKYEVNGKPEERLIYYAHSERQLFVVLPFFSGSSGLNSFASIEGVAELIRSNLPQ